MVHEDARVHSVGAVVNSDASRGSAATTCRSARPNAGEGIRIRISGGIGREIDGGKRDGGSERSETATWTSGGGTAHIGKRVGNARAGRAATVRMAGGRGENRERRERDNQTLTLSVLKAFAREAERIDALNRGHLAFLELEIVADSVEGVQSLLKSHSQFEARLRAQEVINICAPSLIHYF